MSVMKNQISSAIFAGRWLQLPLYLGLLVILAAYVYRYLHELGHLVGHLNSLDDVQIMLGVLDLIDIVMIANLMVMVLMGGYGTFVSPLIIKSDSEKPEWLDHIDAGAMKVKLALALIGISSIHLLRTFIDPSKHDFYSILWQVVIHLTLVISAIAIAYTNNLLGASYADSHR